MSLVAFFLVMCSAGCTNLMPPSNKKQRIFQGAGVLFLLAAVCTCIAVSWYFATVLDQYYVFGAFSGAGGGAFGSNLGFGERFVAGYCIYRMENKIRLLFTWDNRCVLKMILFLLYLGWVATIGGVIGSIIMCYTGHASNNREETYEDYNNETNTGYQPYAPPDNHRSIPTVKPDVHRPVPTVKQDEE